MSAKLALVLLIWVCALLFGWQVHLALIAALLLARYALPVWKPYSPRAAAAFTRFLLYSVAVGVLIVALNALFVPGETWLFQFWGLRFSTDGAEFGLRTAARLLLLSHAVLLFFISTPLRELIRFFQQSGLPPPLVLTLLLTLHFVDRLPARINQIFIAQEARGAPVRGGVVSRARSLLTILSPLVLSSLAESIERGTALELRGFPPRSSLVNNTSNERERTNVLTAILLILSVLLALTGALQWLSR